MYEVLPTDLSVLEQKFDGRYLTMVTCTPPGTYLRRLVIKARIVDF
jgi:sortase A